MFGASRYLHLTRLPIFCDEAIYLRWAQVANQDASLRFVSLTDGKQPLQTWLTLPLLRLIDDPLRAGRVLSNFTGFGLLLLSFPVAYLFFKDKKPVYFLPLLVVFCPYLLFFDRMALAESLLTLFVFGGFTFSYLLGQYQRLDIALLAGLWLGTGLLVKSQMMIFLLLFPGGVIFSLKDNWSNWWDVIKRYLPLYLVIVILALGMYNIQRLSPWMYRIAQKNTEFVVPLGEAVRDLRRVSYNLRLAGQWFWRYLTPPVFLAAILGLVLLIRKRFWQGMFLLGWILVPAVGAAFIARFFTSRYLAFLAPFFLLAASYFFSVIYRLISRRISPKVFVLFCSLFLALPVYLILQLHYSPEQFPFTSTDRGYIAGWTAGYGVKETAEHLKQVATDQMVVAGTEGTFGLLSQGLEIYVNGQDNITVKGYYPLPELPPEELQEAANEGKKVYFLVNNTAGDFSQENLVLREEFVKQGGEGSLRVYEILRQD